MTAVKQAACSKAAVRRHQTTCRLGEYWTMVWRMWWRQTSGDGDWRQALTCTRLRDTMVRSCVGTSTSVLPVWSPHGVSAIHAEQVRCVHGDPSMWLTWRLRSVETAVIEVSCRWRRTKLSCSSPGDCRWTPGLMSMQRCVVLLSKSFSLVLRSLNAGYKSNNVHVRYAATQCNCWRWVIFLLNLLNLCRWKENYLSNNSFNPLFRCFIFNEKKH